MTGGNAGVQTYPDAWAAVADHATAYGVDTVFGLPNDDLAALTAFEHRSTRVVLCRDQRNAAFMATGYALASGRPGVCVLGKGPAVTNALTGVLEARSARIPLLVYASGTSGDQLGTGAHQELDQLAVMRPLTKWAVRVEDARRVCAVLDKAAIVATHGSPGPVYVELPESVAADEVVREQPWRTGPRQYPAPAPDALAEAYELMRAARRPMVLVGGGARHRNRHAIVEQLAETIGAGIAATASGRSAVSESHPSFCGLSGLYAPDAAVPLWRQADLVVALGSRLEETATVGWPRPPAPVVQVTLAEADVATGYAGVVLLADVAHTVSGWLELSRKVPPERDRDWPDQIATVRAAMRPATTRPARPGPVGAGVAVTEVLRTLDRVVPANRILVQENGLQDMWSYFYPYWSCGATGGSIVASEQTSLGFAAAAAVGAACADSTRPVVALVGDGAFNVFRPDLGTLADLDVGVLYVVLDNGGYGWLQANLHQRAPGSRFRFTSGSRPGPVAGDPAITQIRVTRPHECEPALRKAWLAASESRSAIVTVQVNLADGPPGFAELASGLPADPQLDRTER